MSEDQIRSTKTGRWREGGEGSSREKDIAANLPETDIVVSRDEGAEETGWTFDDFCPISQLVSEAQFPWPHALPADSQEAAICDEPA
jgi:hypothetical protein